ncbi:MAG: anthranilate synthase component I [Fimbriimonadaceae bacterium]|nr:anthranilate synthase component I [Fimbriimonadaceae bacterium]
MVSPSRDEYAKWAGLGGPVPVTLDVLADTTTPLGAYWKISHDEKYSFFLESVTGGEQIARYSFMGARPRSVLRAKDGHATVVTADGHVAVNRDDVQDPLALLRDLLPRVADELTAGLPKFLGGAVGMVAYDYVRTIEKLDRSTEDDLHVPDVAMLVTDTVVAFDHAKNLYRIIALADGTPDGYDRAVAEVERLRSRLLGPLPKLPSGQFPVHTVEANVTQEEFEANVTRIIAYIGAGDGLQMLPSVRFKTQLDAHPLTLYRALRSLNPSPYMFTFRMGDFDIVGASPELLVGLEGRTARVRPIAGTRWRGASQEEDNKLAEELLSDEKERAEHVMLIDLGRNDLGRVCDFGTVVVDDMMVVERYSHVMHIVSQVHGRLRDGLDAVDLLRSAFPAGTVTGAPKVRAMQIIEELERTRRGLYGGAVGYFSQNGDLDTAIALRTVLVKDGTAYVQAGAGIVWDSKPDYEWRECHNKAKACLRAIESAQAGL